MVLQCGDGNSGADFSDLPEMNSGTDRDEIEGRFELSPYFQSCRIPNFRNQGNWCHLQRVPTSTTLCHILPVMVISIVRYRIMSFFAAKGMIAVSKGGAEIMVHRLAYGELTGSNPDNDHRIGATCCHFRKIHCRAIDYVFLCSKKTVTIKRKTIWKSYQSKERPLKRWSPSSTVSSAEWMPSAIGTGKRQ
ncbi:hypothetical protein EEL42_12355 [Muribaculaceae bacterium Isolate-100 (HZI)]|nr:hypothetical protein EEL42_12355 [Muribaculaceae bacterium Isolate-100 (HZI)]